jgi:hypothetical protein
MHEFASICGEQVEQAIAVEVEPRDAPSHHFREEVSIRDDVTESLKLDSRCAGDIPKSDGRSMNFPVLTLITDFEQIAEL